MFGLGQKPGIRSEKNTTQSAPPPPTKCDIGGQETVCEIGGARDAAFLGPTLLMTPSPIWGVGNGHRGGADLAERSVDPPTEGAGEVSFGRLCPCTLHSCKIGPLPSHTL